MDKFVISLSGNISKKVSSTDSIRNKQPKNRSANGSPRRENLSLCGSRSIKRIKTNDLEDSILDIFKNNEYQDSQTDQNHSERPFLFIENFKNATIQEIENQASKDDTEPIKFTKKEERELNRSLKIWIDRRKKEGYCDDDLFAEIIGASNRYI